MATFKMPKAEKSKAAGSLPVDNTEHQRPPTLHLEHGHLEQLGMKTMPKVGSKLKFHVTAHVGSTSENQDRGDGGGKPRRHMSLDIHQMEMGKDGPDNDVEQEEESKAGAKAEMDKALAKGAGNESKKGGKKG